MVVTSEIEVTTCLSFAPILLNNGREKAGRSHGQAHGADCLSGTIDGP